MSKKQSKYQIGKVDRESINWRKDISLLGHNIKKSNSRIIAKGGDLTGNYE